VRTSRKYRQEGVRQTMELTQLLLALKKGSWFGSGCGAQSLLNVWCSSRLGLTDCLLLCWSHVSWSRWLHEWPCWCSGAILLSNYIWWPWLVVFSAISKHSGC
jgi:hypothetical protein